MYTPIFLTVLFITIANTAKRPRIYNVLITSKKNLSPSHALPVYEPVIRTTSLGFAFPPLIYQPIYSPYHPITAFQPVGLPQPYPIQHNLQSPQVKRKGEPSDDLQNPIDSPLPIQRRFDYADLYPIQDGELYYNQDKKYPVIKHVSSPQPYPISPSPQVERKGPANLQTPSGVPSPVEEQNDSADLYPIPNTELDYGQNKKRPVANQISSRHEYLIPTNIQPPEVGRKGEPAFHLQSPSDISLPIDRHSDNSDLYPVLDDRLYVNQDKKQPVLNHISSLQAYPVQPSIQPPQVERTGKPADDLQNPSKTPLPVEKHVAYADLYPIPDDELYHTQDRERPVVNRITSPQAYPIQPSIQPPQFERRSESTANLEDPADVPQPVERYIDYSNFYSLPDDRSYYNLDKGQPTEVKRLPERIKQTIPIPANFKKNPEIPDVPPPPIPTRFRKP